MLRIVSLGALPGSDNNYHVFNSPVCENVNDVNHPSIADYGGLKNDSFSVKWLTAFMTISQIHSADVDNIILKDFFFAVNEE